MGEKYTIVADHREYASDCYKLLSGHPLADLKTNTLPIGDYETNRCIFERKTLVNLGKSITDGRLFKQMHRLLSMQKRVAFIIEGSPELMGCHGVSRESLQGAIITMTLIHGVFVFYAMSAEETIQIIVFSLRQQRMAKNIGVIRMKLFERSQTKRQLYILQGFPGAGPFRAKCLLAYFGSIKKVMNADLGELIKVTGIGREIALSILKILA